MTAVDPLQEAMAEWEGVALPTLFHATRWAVDLDAVIYRLRSDTQFALEMRFCKDWRIPHSELLGWPEEDQTKALAYFIHEAQRCSDCGIHPNDWPDPDDPIYQVEVRTCPGCAEFARWQRWAQEQSEATNSRDAMDGVKPYLKHREG